MPLSLLSTTTAAVSVSAGPPQRSRDASVCDRGGQRGQRGPSRPASAAQVVQTVGSFSSVRRFVTSGSACGGRPAAAASSSPTATTGAAALTATTTTSVSASTSTALYTGRSGMFPSVSAFPSQRSTLSICAGSVLSSAAVTEERPPLYDVSLPYVQHLEGPILLTAPHGLELFRGGSFGEKTRVHYRERWVTELTLKLSQAVAKKLPSLMGSASYVVWNCATARKQDERNLDPNYLIERDFQKSPWHQALVKWRKLFEDAKVCLLHVDLHGKVDRKDNLNIDVGVGAMEELWAGNPVVPALKNTLVKELTKALEGRRLYGYKQLRMGVEKDPTLRGHNTRGFHTMAHQSVLLGVPAIQLELPKTVRKALLVEHVLFDKFADAIVNTYVQVFGKQAFSPDSIPGHYPVTFKRTLEDAAEAKKLAAQAKAEQKSAEKARRKASAARGFGQGPGLVSGSAYSAAVTLPAAQPQKLTRAAAMCKQLLADLESFELACTDKMI